MTGKLKSEPSSLPSTDRTFQPSTYPRESLQQSLNSYLRRPDSLSTVDDSSSLYLESTYGNILTSDTDSSATSLLQSHEQRRIVDNATKMGFSQLPSTPEDCPIRPSYGTMNSSDSLAFEQLENTESNIAQAVAPTEICMISRLDSRSNNVSEYCATQTETDQLLGNTSKWSESHSVQELETTWQAEAKLLTKNAAPLVVTLALQYSLTIASVFSAGNLGSNELAACSLASMTANITGIAIYNGLAAALDTLCSQAYGAGNKILVGVYLQRMAAFLMVLTIPISMVWWNGEQILRMMIPEPELARLAGLYLRVLAFGMPGHALFECGRRYTQAQGLFRAPMIVLLITAPLNMLLNYLLVWNSHIGLGFVGAPLAVVISNYCMPFFLFLYIRFYSGSDCWGGFTRRAFQNWWPMIKLALPGLVMVEAEFLAFEALVLMASHISGAHVAANAIVAQCGSVLWRFSFALSIATSTRVGIFVGAMAPEAAKTTANTSLVLSCILGCINASILFSTRYQIPRLFSKDEHVIAIAAAAMPLVGFFQIADCIQCVAAGVLRGQGRQYIGSYVNLVAYYIVALPWSYYTCFFLAWELMGLWSGMAIALALIAVVECFVVLVTNWKRVVGECRARESWA